jgi:CHAD domain-containing protein
MPARASRSRSTHVSSDAKRLAHELSRLRGELLDRPPLERGSTCGEVVASALSSDVRRLLGYLGELSTSSDIETLHQARVALRRLRTDLRTFRPLLETEAPAGLAPDLVWLTTSIGQVRDHDVFVEILSGYERHAPDELGLARLAAGYRARRPTMLARLTEVLVAERTFATLSAVGTLATDPPLVALADEPAADVLTELARGPWFKLARDARRLDASSPVEQLHELRLRVKKARYAAQAAALVRPEASRHVRALARLQTTLGDINDASNTIHRLEGDAARDLDGERAFAAGVVTTMERRRIEERRQQWPGRWDLARRRRVRAWLEEPG